MDFRSVNDFNFHNSFEDDSLNGLYFNDHYLPQEILWNIFSFISPTELLNLSLVCKKWCNIIKSEQFWMHLYQTFHPFKVKHLPWYVYYSFFATTNFQNLLKNTSGEEGVRHWKIIENGGQDPPTGTDTLPLEVKDCNGNTSCFATYFQDCSMIQEISLGNKRLLHYIIKKHKPHMYVSEWWAGKSDCWSHYKLEITGFGSFEETKLKNKRAPLFYRYAEREVEKWQGRAWRKVEIVVKDFPDDVMTLVFGHLGSVKMAGGVLKFEFDSIEPLNATEGMKMKYLQFQYYYD